MQEADKVTINYRTAEADEDAEKDLRISLEVFNLQESRENINYEPA